MLIGYFLIISKKVSVNSPNHKKFTLICTLFFLPVGLSAFSAEQFQLPLKIFILGFFVILPAGIAVIHAFNSQTLKKWHNIAFISIVSFWFIDAFCQWIFGHNHMGIPANPKGINGPFSDWGHFAYYAGPMSGFLLFPLANIYKNKFGLITICLLTSWAMMLSTRRGGMIMHALIICVFIYYAYLPMFKRKYATICIILCLYILEIFFCYNVYEPFAERVNRSAKITQNEKQHTSYALTGRNKIWKDSIIAFKENVILGYGARNFGRTPSHEKYAHPHHVYLEILVGTGLVGFISFLYTHWLIAKWWIRTPSAHKKNGLPFLCFILAMFFPFTSHRAIYASELLLITFIIIAFFTTFLRSDNHEII